MGTAAFGGVGHAGLWRGTPGSWFILHALLSEEITNSVANAVEVDGDVVRVAGWGHDIEVGGDVALLWVYGSAP